MTEAEFEQMVNWVCIATEKISDIMKNQPVNPFINVRFEPIISALLSLLEQQTLVKEL